MLKFVIGLISQVFGVLLSFYILFLKSSGNSGYDYEYFFKFYKPWLPNICILVVVFVVLYNVFLPGYFKRMGFDLRLVCLLKFSLVIIVAFVIGICIDVISKNIRSERKLLGLPTDIHCADIDRLSLNGYPVSNLEWAPDNIKEIEIIDNQGQPLTISGSRVCLNTLKLANVGVVNIKPLHNCLAKSMTTLEMSSVKSIEDLSFLSDFNKLERLRLDDLPNLKKIGLKKDFFKNLKVLELSRLPSLQSWEFLSTFEFPLLESLTVGRAKIIDVDVNLSRLSNLKEISLQYISIDGEICLPKNLKKVELNSLRNSNGVSKDFIKFGSGNKVQYLFLRNVEKTKPFSGQFPNLSDLTLEDMTVQEVNQEVSTIVGLESLTLKSIKGLIELKQLSVKAQLDELTLTTCIDLKSFGDIGDFDKLSSLTMEGLPLFVADFEEDSFSNLKALTIVNVGGLSFEKWRPQYLKALSLTGVNKKLKIKDRTWLESLASLEVITCEAEDLDSLFLSSKLKRLVQQESKVRRATLERALLMNSISQFSWVPDSSGFENNSFLKELGLDLSSISKIQYEVSFLGEGYGTSVQKLHLEMTGFSGVGSPDFSHLDLHSLYLLGVKIDNVSMLPRNLKSLSLFNQAGLH